MNTNQEENNYFKELEEINYGRLEIRTCEVFNDLNEINSNWYGLKSIS